MVNRIVVGAGYGFKDWMIQRFTAGYMIVYTLIMAAALLAGGAGGQEAWRGLMSNGFIRFSTFIFIVALCWHAWIGVRDIWMDYAKPASVRLALHVLTIIVLVGDAGWAVQVIWRL